MADALARSPRTEKLFCAPGSDAIDALAERVDISGDDVEGLVRFAKDQSIGMTVVGPEAPLVAGLVDRFAEEGLKVFGPTQRAAALEGSKVFTKNLLRKYRIPTGDYQTFDDPKTALLSIEQRGQFPVVIKADGLAAGKGVIIAETLEAARAALDRIMVRQEFGKSGTRVLVEEFLTGEEVSLLAITDGKTIVTLDPARDHKAVFDGGAGPNTGGMGAFCPSPFQGDLQAKIEQTVLIPIIHALSREGRPYQGVLYAGLMLTDTGPKVLEFNVRFGDPEAQVILPRLETDFVELCEKTCDGRLEELEALAFAEDPALVVVLASQGYPGKPTTGQKITGLDQAAEVPGVSLYHSGTRREGQHWVTSGGRVLGVTAKGATLEEARQRAYQAVNAIEFAGMHYRRDIGIARG